MHVSVTFWYNNNFTLQINISKTNRACNRFLYYSKRIWNLQQQHWISQSSSNDQNILIISKRLSAEYSNDFKTYLLYLGSFSLTFYKSIIVFLLKIQVIFQKWKLGKSI